MKKLQFITGSVFYLLSACISLSCSNLDDVTPELSRVKLRAIHDSATRVSFDGSTSKWEDGDNINVVLDRLNKIYNFTYEASSKDYFYCDNIPLEDGDNIYAFYGVPTESIKVTNKSAHVLLASPVQTQDVASATSHIATHDILYGKAENLLKDDIKMPMNHSTAAIKINIKNSLSETKKIKAVNITTPTNVAATGFYTIDATDGEFIIDYPNGGYNIVTVTPNADVSLSNSDNYAIWAAVAPFTLSSGEKFTIDIVTDDGVYRCEKTIGSSGLEFGAGNVMATNITLGGNATLLNIVNVDVNMNALAVIGFPPSWEKPDAKNEPITNEYVFGGYTFGIKSPTPFYYEGQKNYRICFDSGINNSNTAMIKLPFIDGYILKFVTLASTGSNNSRGYNFSIKGYEYHNTIGKAKVLTGDTFIYELNDIKGNKNYYICIGNSSTNNNSANLSHISLEYEKVD